MYFPDSKTLTDILALMTVMFWPAIPLFWIPVHSLPKMFKKLGLLTYILPLITWLPLAYFIYQKRDYLLQYRIEFPAVLHILGLGALVSGTLLHFWTIRLLGWGIIGVPEVTELRPGRFVKKGPFSRVRHPTYLAHTLIFSGVFFITGSAAAGVVAVADLILVNAFIIPLEDRELLARFGTEYSRYKEKVPAFFPRIRL